MSAKTYTDTELNKLRAVQTEMLGAVIEICERHNISYCAVAGTVLGAVRHGGYIPWDDDLDIAMPRADYERFLEHAKDELDERFFLQNFETEQTCVNYFTKIRRNGTLFVQESDVKVDMHRGIFIDIFPLDKLPSDEAEQKSFRKKQSFIYQCYIAKSTCGTMGSTQSLKGKIKKLIRTSLHVLTSVVPKKKLYGKLDLLLKKYNSSDSEFLMQSPEYASNGLVHPAHLLFPTVEHNFEGMTIKIPGKYHEYLSLRYGDDYMELPPEEKRINHRPVELSFKE